MPMVLVYHVNSLTYFLGRLLIRVKLIGLVNIVAEKQMAHELIQGDFKVGKAAELIGYLLTEEGNRTARSELGVIRKKLGEPGASQRAAHIIADVLNK